MNWGISIYFKYFGINIHILKTLLIILYIHPSIICKTSENSLGLVYLPSEEDDQIA